MTVAQLAGEESSARALEGGEMETQLRFLGAPGTGAGEMVAAREFLLNLLPWLEKHCISDAQLFPFLDLSLGTEDDSSPRLPDHLKI